VTSPLTAQQQSVTQRIVDVLRGERAVAGIALGGSFARGHATDTSDIDLVLFYDESQPPAPSRLDAIVAALTPDTTPAFTQIGEWGPWVNGGAWLSFADQRVDVLYRSLQQCQRVLGDCAEGRWELHWAQQPPYGYFSPTFVEELNICVPLFERSHTLADLRARAQVYPDALRRRIVQDFLWSSEFNLSTFAPKYVAAADAYGFAGCASRVCFQLVQVIYALNRQWPPPDRVALKRAAALSIVPADFATRVQAVLARMGASAAAQAKSATHLRELWQETVQLSAGLYAPRTLPTSANKG
jgi:hypothetical protein